MNTYLNLASSTLLLFLVLILASLSTSLLLRVLNHRLSGSQMGDWLTENETSVAVSIWAVVALTSFYLGPRLLMYLMAHAGQ